MSRVAHGHPTKGHMDEERQDADPREDLDAVRKQTDEPNPREKAEEEVENDPSRNPEDNRLKGIK